MVQIIFEKSSPVSLNNSLSEPVAESYRCTQKLEKTVKGISPVRGGEVEVTIYIGDINSKKMSDVKDCNAHWFSRESIRALRLSNITKDVLEYYFSEVRGE